MRKWKNIKANICLLLLFTIAAKASKVNAQTDSLILINKDVIVGELKSLDKGVVTIETDYSKSDFTIEWKKVKEIYSKTSFIITLKDARRINGFFHSIDSTGKIAITTTDSQQVLAALDDVVYLKGLKSAFWSRVHANVDLGISITKANNLRQYSMRSAIGYLADKWLLDVYYNDTRSRQDSIEATKRTEAGVTFNYFLPNDWFLVGAISTLSNTEQLLKLRFTGKTGAGKYIVHTNKSYFGVGAGLSVNNETFTNGTPKRTSLEGYMGTEVNLFDIGDFALLSNLYVYPSFTEKGRWRYDFKLDTKYDLPLDLYVKLGVTINYDNRPAGGSKTDYVYVFGIGWEL